MFSDHPPEGQGPDGAATGRMLMVATYSNSRPETLRPPKGHWDPVTTLSPNDAPVQQEVARNGNGCPLFYQKGQNVRSDLGGHDGPPLLSPPTGEKVPNRRILPDPRDQLQHTSPLKPPRPSRIERPTSPLTLQTGNLSNPHPLNLAIPAQRAYINKLLTRPWRPDFLDLPVQVGSPTRERFAIKACKTFFGVPGCLLPNTASI